VPATGPSMRAMTSTPMSMTAPFSANQIMRKRRKSGAKIISARGSSRNGGGYSYTSMSNDAMRRGVRGAVGLWYGSEYSSSAYTFGIVEIERAAT